MGIIKQELDQVKQIHNTHRIRTYPNQECPIGRPNLIYNVPENFGSSYHVWKDSIGISKIALHLTLLFYIFRCFPYLSLFFKTPRIR